MPADNEHDPLDRWLNQQVRPLPPPAGTFELITKRARRRRIRKAVISVASAAAVAAAVGVAVPVSMSLHLNTTSTKASLAGGAASTGSAASQSTLGSANKQPSPEPTLPAPSGVTTPPSAGTTTPGTKSPGPAVSGYLPPNFQPYSVTWDSLSTGWVIGPAGTPGHCANPDPDICTSVARTDDGGRTWQGLPAPDTGSPDGPSGVSGIRFLDGVNGWAFGPELWVTHDGGKTWAKIATGGQRVTDLETAGNQAYALFAQCTGSSPAGFASACTSYTLMTTVKDSDKWTPAGGATNGLTNQGAATSGAIALIGATGYLSAPDGTLYSGPIGGTWQRAGTLPCQPGTAQSNGLPAVANVTPVSATTLATVCDGDTPESSPKVYTSADSGATWTLVTADWTGVSDHGPPVSFAATSSGTLLLATGQGIYLLPTGAAHWQASSASGSAAPTGGFSYIGMTSPAQGVALPADTSQHEIWMTADGGKTWQAHPITS
jgi:photosystem II stability/assembly factor-like uncharacterized protein